MKLKMIFNKIHIDYINKKRKKLLKNNEYFHVSVVFSIRSHGNSRGVNSREVRGFFGHSSESTGWILTKIGANCSYKPPGAF